MIQLMDDVIKMSGSRRREDMPLTSHEQITRKCYADAESRLRTRDMSIYFLSSKDHFEQSYYSFFFFSSNYRSKLASHFDKVARNFDGVT